MSPPVTRVLLLGRQGALGGSIEQRLVAMSDRFRLVSGSDGDRVDVIVDAATGDYDLLGLTGASAAVTVAGTLDEAERLGADHVVLVTSAMVYGAISNNPVPLTEDAVLRPDPAFAFARQLAAGEELLDRWRTGRPGRVATVLRPAVVVGSHSVSPLAGALTAGLGQRFGETDPGAQFIHVDDLVEAVVRSVSGRLDGVFNVAPDGWIPGDRLRALSGRRWRLPLPDRAAEVVASVRWRFQRGPIPPGLASYIREPWIVANDKLKATGWAPTVTNEQAFVEGTETGWWAMITPQRRQELALGAMIGLIALGGVVSTTLLRVFVRSRANGPRSLG